MIQNDDYVLGLCPTADFIHGELVIAATSIERRRSIRLRHQVSKSK